MIKRCWESTQVHTWCRECIYSSLSSPVFFSRPATLSPSHKTLTLSPWSPSPCPLLFIHQPLLHFPPTLLFPPSLTRLSNICLTTRQSLFKKKKRKTSSGSGDGGSGGELICVSVHVLYIRMWTCTSEVHKRREGRTGGETPSPSLTQIGDGGWWAVMTADGAGLACR